MASAVRRLGALTLGTVVFGPLAVGTAGYAAVKVDWKAAIQSFVSGPGRTSRILLLVFVFFNWKSVPFAWTVGSSPNAADLPPRLCLGL